MKIKLPVIMSLLLVSCQFSPANASNTDQDSSKDMCEDLQKVLR